MLIGIRGTFFPRYDYRFIVSSDTIFDSNTGLRTCTISNLFTPKWLAQSVVVKVVVKLHTIYSGETAQIVSILWWKKTPPISVEFSHPHVIPFGILLALLTWFLHLVAAGCQMGSHSLLVMFLNLVGEIRVPNRIICEGEPCWNGGCFSIFKAVSQGAP